MLNTDRCDGCFSKNTADSDMLKAGCYDSKMLLCQSHFTKTLRSICPALRVTISYILVRSPFQSIRKTLVELCEGTIVGWA